MKKYVLFLMSLTVVLSSCKQKSTLIKERNQVLTTNLEKRLNYSPKLSVMNFGLDEEDEPEDITVYLNHNNQKGVRCN